MFYSGDKTKRRKTRFYTVFLLIVLAMGGIVFIFSRPRQCEESLGLISKQLDVLLARPVRPIVKVRHITSLLSTKVVETKETNVLDRLHLQLQTILKDLQNPTDGTRANYLVCDVHNIGCGFGCLLHRMSWCLAHAVMEKRTMVLKPATLHGYGQNCKHRWDCFFEPLSTCSSWVELNPTPADAHHFVFSESPYTKKYHTFLPKALSKLETYTDHAHEWFYGHLVGQIFRPNQRLRNLLHKNIPDVGIHIRRGDKLQSEAKKYEVREYINHVDLLIHPSRHYHYSYDEKYGVTVWLATDEPSVVKEALLFKQYQFLHQDMTIISTAQTGHDLDGVIQDIWMMSRAKSFVGTFSSQIGRIVLELFYAQGRHDAMDHVYSLDENYYYAM